MKFTVQRDAVHNALAPLSRIAPTRSTLPILANVILTAEGDTLTIGATNLELSMARALRATVEDPGAITVNAKTLADYVAVLPSGSAIAAVLDDRSKRLSLTCATSKANIAGIDAEDFPPMFKGDGQWLELMTLPAALLRSVIGDVEFAAAPDDSRPVLGGVLIKGGGGAYEFAAADGFRLAVRTIPKPLGAPPDVTYIIPARALRELRRTLPEDETEVTLAVGAAQLRCVVGHTTLYTRMVEGPFPDYPRIIPAVTPLRVTVDRLALLHAVKTAAVFTRDNAMITRLAIDTETATLTVSSNAAETGDAQSDVELVEVLGDPLSIGVNSRYAMDALEQLRSETVELACSGATSPVLIRPVGDEHDAVLMVVMPMTLAQEAKVAA